MSSLLPLISVVVITYKHEEYIAETILSILDQFYNSEFEVIVSDDFSPDSTFEKVNEIIRYHPKGSYIKYFRHESNKGVINNFCWVLNQCVGKYVAICEGDDYWTDRNKLITQVGFMEKNNNVSFCFHNAQVLEVNTNLFSLFNKNLLEGYYSLYDLLLKEWFIPTASILFRRQSLELPLQNWFYKVHSGDYALSLVLARNNKFYYFDKTMSVYRKNSINSESVRVGNSFNHLYKKIELIRQFSKSLSMDLKIVSSIAILKIQFQVFRAIIYLNFPILLRLKKIF